MTDNRYLRQQQIIPAGRLAAVKATVIGVGAIGRQVALQLAAIGVPWLQLIDHDIVEEVNLAPQGYLEADLGRPKVEATAALCRRINSGVEDHVEQARFRRSMEIGNAVFMCVDSITTRQVIWQATKDRADFICDTRMSAEVVRIVTAADATGRANYPSTLFEAAEAFQGSCTAKSTIFTANIAAGLALSQLSKWLRHLPIEPDVTLNLLSTELAVAV